MGSSEPISACILVVEDDPVLHELVVKIVRRSGHQAVSAHTGEEALSILRDRGEHIDWLLTDIRLPGTIDGWVVGSEFTLNHPFQSVIYMSGVEEDYASRRAMNSTFLQKPVNVGDLVGTFRALSRTSAALRHLPDRPA
jgi:two-component system, OmpR family, response regulator